MITRMLVQTTVWLAVMAAILFVAAGDWRWSEAWLYLAEVALLTLALSFWLLIHDPALLASRMTSPVRRDQIPWDRLFMVVLITVFVGWLALIGADARRFAWSHVPVWAEGMGAAMLALGMGVIWQTFRYNTFAAPQVRVQADRAHHVVTDGPYRIVRHPMYAGAILWLLGAPLMLGSLWGVAAVPLIAAALGWRAVGEERMLRRELTGYDDYAQRVRYRLIPGVW
jgi:protein-S-isoprenylcysteine O-methyltransferase Ste14